MCDSNEQAGSEGRTDALSSEELQQQVKELSEELEQKEQTIQDYLDTMRRIQADFENYKKRTEREIDSITTYANERLILKLLEMKDNFERVLASDAAKNLPVEYLKGFTMIYNQLCKILSGEEVQQIECLNKRFDPTLHEALVMEEGTEGDEEIVSDEFVKGYTYKDKVIRHAKVKVRKDSQHYEGE